MHNLPTSQRQMGLALMTSGVVANEVGKKPPPTVGDSCDGWGYRCRGERAYASAKLRVIDGSTGIPGPVVVETVIFFR
jgi:hypothetical protein